MQHPYPDELAERLVGARRTGRRVADLESARYLDLDDAYRAQASFITQWCDATGDRVGGYKVSATSEAAQAGLGIVEPVLGTLFEADVLESGALVSIDRPALVEAELVFVLREDLPELCTRERVLQATLVAPGIELPDSRYESWPEGMTSYSAQDIVADDTFAGKLVVGTAVPLDALDVSRVGVQLTRDGKTLARGSSTVVLGDPLRVVSWLARSVHRVGGKLAAGMVIASGAVVGPLVVGDGHYGAEFDCLGTAGVTLFGADAPGG